jgi:para-aminobenzoate synthetase/4-amino-4-deoxychorismate lyase
VVLARFDDLTGGQASFRLAEPIGVLAATRPSEVPEVVAAAEAAAARGAWVAGFLAYEAAPGFDATLRVRTPAPDDPFAALPLAWFAIFARREETVLPEPSSAAAPALLAWRATVGRERYEAAVAAIRERIAAGDTYQVNHTIRLRARLAGDPRGLYRDLCYAQRCAYAAYLDTGAFRICSASPELFFRIDGPTITTRPMKGTAPRGRLLAEDERVRARLTTSVKDRAENAMIVDLLRNDLGRIARPGSVRWNDVFEPERYETVWQLTSTVAADLEPGTDLVAVMRALFPSGSVTGAPKASTMGIIAELEDAPRGVYCGAVGYLAPPDAGDPRARFSVAIRTVVIEAATGIAEYGVGGGITWDSRAESEYEEIVAKARVLVARRPAFELLETVRHDPGVGFRHLERHLRRLRDSAGYFGYVFERERVVEAMERAVRRVPDRPARVRVLLDRRGRVRTGIAPLAQAPGPVRLAIDRDHPVDPRDELLYHKTSLRGRYDEARGRHPDADDVVLVNVHGEVTETTIGNLVVRLDGRWWTPPLDAGLLPGIERAALLDAGRIAERPITLAELEDAEALAVINSVRGWRDARLG